MNKDNEFYLVIALFLAPLIFSTIDFSRSLVDHGIITWFNCYTFKIFFISIPILIICSIIAKLIWREKSIDEITKYTFLPLFIWFFEIGFALFISLFIGVFADMTIGMESMI